MIGQEAAMALGFNHATAMDFLDGKLQNPLLLFVILLVCKTHLKFTFAREGC